MKTTPLWAPSESGVLVPSGSIVEGGDRRNTTIHHVKDRALAIEAVFQEHGVSIPPNGDLQGMLNKVKEMSDARLMNQIEKFDLIDFFDALHVERLADAILPLDTFAGASVYLRKLVSGSLDFFAREPSPAKDVFWELELWALLRKRNAAVNLVDPPDIVLNLERGDLGVACKKLYSEKHVQDVLSKAVKQVSTFDVAVAAINIDDLLQPGKLYKAATAAEMTTVVRGVVDQFIARHERHFRKYLTAQRLVGAVITCSLIVDVAEWSPSLNNARQSTVWCFPGLDAEASARVRELERLVVG